VNKKEYLKDFISLEKAIPALTGGGWRKSIRGALENLLGITTCRELVSNAALAPTHNVFARSLEILDILVDSKGVPEAIKSLQKNTGAIIVANHPFGGADAIALCSLLVEFRPDDSKILANSVVYNAPKFPNYLLPLKILGEPYATKHNLKILKAASEHLKSGGLLGVFPAGGVSHYQRAQGEITDVPWSEHITRIALRTQVPVIPVRFFGKNPLKCRAGAIITHQTLSAAENPTAFLRNAVYTIPE
jgi:putative hemolysin